MKLSRAIFTFILIVMSANSFSQDAGEDELMLDHKNDLLVVVGGGLAGAVLGLSTLSFVEEPKDHTRNILVGASIGIIAGVAYVAFNQANKSKSLMLGPQEDASTNPRDFNTYARNSWHMNEVISKSNPISSLNQVNYRFQF